MKVTQTHAPAKHPAATAKDSGHDMSSLHWHDGLTETNQNAVYVDLVLRKSEDDPADNQCQYRTPIPESDAFSLSGDITHLSCPKWITVISVNQNSSHRFLRSQMMSVRPVPTR